MKKIVMLCLVLTCTLSLSAGTSTRKRVIKSKDGDVTITFKMLSPSESFHLIGPFLRPANKTMRAVKVEVHNDSPYTVVCQKDSYFNGLEDCFISKDLLIELYKEKLTEETSNMKTDLFGGTILTALASWLGYFGYSSYHADQELVIQDRARYRTNSWKSPAFIAAMLGGLGLLVGGNGVIGGRQKIGSIKTKMNNQLLKPRCYTENKRLQRKYSIYADFYKIAPGCTLFDWFFIDTKTASPDILNKAELTFNGTYNYEAIEDEEPRA